MKLLPRLHRYFLKEFLGSWLAVSLILYLILVSHRLVYLLNLAAQGRFSTHVVLPLIGLVSLSFLPVILGFTFFLAALMVIGRFARDHELTVMFSCGLGPQKLFGAIFFPALPVMLLLLLMTLWLSPLAEQKAHHIREVAEQSGPLATLEPGRFATLDGGRLTVYVADVPKGGAEVKELFVQYQEDDRQILITAREAHIVRDSDNAPSYIEFIDGVRYQGEAGQADWQVTQFAKHGLKLKEPRSPLVQDEPSMLLPEVLVRSDRVEYAAELQWRLAVPVMLFVSLWLVLPLGNAPPRQGRFGRLLVGIVLYMLYLNGLMLLKKYIGDGRFPVFPGLWMIHAMALAAVWGVNQHQFGRRSVRPIRQEEGRS